MQDDRNTELPPDELPAVVPVEPAHSSQDLVDRATAETTESAPLDIPAGEKMLPEFCRLDARAIRLWRLAALLIWAVVCCFFFVGGCVLWILTPTPRFIIPLVWIMVGSLCFINVAWLPKWRHARWTYRIDHRILELRFGIFWHVSVLIPLSRLQHIDLHRGPLERSFGLASLEIHTAGTRDASHKIPGLDAHAAEQLRDDLLADADLRAYEPARN